MYNVVECVAVVEVTDFVTEGPCQQRSACARAKWITGSLTYDYESLNYRLYCNSLAPRNSILSKFHINSTCHIFQCLVCIYKYIHITF